MLDSSYIPYIVLFILSALTASAIIYMRHEAIRLKVEHIYPFKPHSIDTHVNLKLLQISDVHLKLLRIPLKEISSHINKIRPDAVLMTGDYIDRPSESPRFLEWIGGLVADTSEQSPVFFLCYGNHDQRAFMKDEYAQGHLKTELEKLGVVVLENMSATFSKGISQYTITGYSDLSSYMQHYMQWNAHQHSQMPDKPTLPPIPPQSALPAISALPDKPTLPPIPPQSALPAISALPTFPPSMATRFGEANNTKIPPIRIGMAHNPDIALYIKDGDIDLLIAGHFHGGQVWLPFKLEYRFLRKERLCKRGITRGLHRVNGNLLYINRGIGCVLFPMRFMSRPEITVFYLP